MSDSPTNNKDQALRDRLEAMLRSNLRVQHKIGARLHDLKVEECTLRELIQMTDPTEKKNSKKPTTTNKTQRRSEAVAEILSELEEAGPSQIHALLLERHGPELAGSHPATVADVLGHPGGRFVKVDHGRWRLKAQ